eukprot:UN15003
MSSALIDEFRASLKAHPKGVGILETLIFLFETAIII